jgi:hypothetical protein
MYEIETYCVPLYEGDDRPWYAVARCAETGSLVRLSGDYATEAEAVREINQWMGWKPCAF